MSDLELPSAWESPTAAFSGVESDRSRGLTVKQPLKVSAVRADHSGSDLPSTPPPREIPDNDFYLQTVLRLLDAGVLHREMKLLVVCGGLYDRDVLLRCGFSNVVISNVDSRMNVDGFAPYPWNYQDAEQLEYADDQFDACVAHSGLHHCRSPHRALLEMYRVAGRAVVVFEPADNLITRLGVRLGLGQEYEVAAVAGNGYRYGGLNNSAIPNYVYRWTPRDVEKAIRTYDPTRKQTFRYFFRWRVPWERSFLLKSHRLNDFFQLVRPLLQLATRIAARQSNNLAFAIEKPAIPAALHPWLTQQDGVVCLNHAWMKERYR